ncbi:MAG: nicotinate (nicotinamide) nucleotide adenylyltransferase [Eubacteriales bacterium]|nr:nicotinate (nicotinamide) nucleotide adenylyltransferase [Eubacteriales bacterium]
MNKKLALFGGSFNPIHNAHIDIALCAIKELLLDEVLLMPTIRPVHKRIAYNISFDDRCKMISLAIKDYSKLKLFDYEKNINYKPYSYLIIKDIKQKYNIDDLYFIIGYDSLNSIEEWYEYKKLLLEVKLVVAPRDNISNEIISKKINFLQEKCNTKIILLSYKKNNISSSNIRFLLSQRTKDQKFNIELAKELNINKKVLEYIIRNKIYL